MFGYRNQGEHVVLREKNRNDVIVCTCDTCEEDEKEAARLNDKERPA